MAPQMHQTPAEDPLGIVDREDRLHAKGGAVPSPPAMPRPGLEAWTTVHEAFVAGWTVGSDRQRSPKAQEHLLNLVKLLWWCS